MKLVTVLMPVYNTKEEWLRLAIESILAQSYRNIELLIVTDGPTDNSCEVVEEYVSKDARVNVFHNEKNLGLIKSLNKGLSIAKGKYIARMDSDDIALPNRLEVELKHLIDNNLNLVGGRLQKIDEAGKEISTPTMIYTDEQVSKVIRYSDCIPHPTWFGTRDMFDKLGGYRDIKYCEDYDLLLRATAHGFRLGMSDQVVLNYRINSGGITRRNSMRQFLSANYLKKNLGRIDEVTQIEIDATINGKINEIEADNFEKSIAFFRDGINAMKEKRYVKGMCSTFRGLFTSKYALTNLRYIIRSNLAMRG